LARQGPPKICSAKWFRKIQINAVALIYSTHANLTYPARLFMISFIPLLISDYAESPRMDVIQFVEPAFISIAILFWVFFSPPTIY
jgi:hypothetical protein